MLRVTARFTPLFSIFTTQSHWPRPIHAITAATSGFSSMSMSTSTLAQSRDNDFSKGTSAIKLSSKARRKAANESPQGVLQRKLNQCSKSGDVVEALHLYDESQKIGVMLNIDHYNKLLYLCSMSPNLSDLALKRGFEIFQQMLNDQVEPNEATFTNAARLAAAKEDPEMAFELLKQMKNVGIAPKLRSYGPALYGFCKMGDAEKAYEVDTDMIESGVTAEEPELAAILEVSVNARNEDKVYEMLHRLRAVVRQVSESTLKMIEDWFNSENATKIGKENWDVNKVREGIVRGGGGWHGQGWLGSGQWKVVKTHVNEDGLCLSCGEKLVSIDIDTKETENFAASLSKLACQREVKANFNHFQKWLEQHGPFDAVVDGANVGLANVHNFSFPHLNSVVQQLRQMSPSNRLPLIILHVSRVTGGPAQNPNNRRLIENWKNNGALYATPQGSNDDWYWLYAAVSCKCLLLTNDEMRDHLFQLLGSGFFPRWKEKHQVRVSASARGASLILPPRYSIVIQESENGSWHVPSVTSDDHEIPRKWLCATRSGKKTLHNLWTSNSMSDGT
ncbi:proteinaceous RNase P 1, chloroplastic/mitochondrial-like [Gastrolobium bilobum]|uniref:proteinaceous RNase P 1, chloroplastic/mitochondrial-like n=1 Tax=Gastrolobium bilobum TaxID=150636 RepID=UPI002AB13CB4|nr:proteinaceous RNase P 1, chloroplastic/mitochondrial-like [Gastrolobium bilobum]